MRGIARNKGLGENIEFNIGRMSEAQERFSIVNGHTVKLEVGNLFRDREPKLNGKNSQRALSSRGVHGFPFPYTFPFKSGNSNFRTRGGHSLYRPYRDVRTIWGGG